VTSALAKRRKRNKDESVDVPITPMLDMAFQLLTFFILTYHPAPTEGQFLMNLLPAAPATDFRAQAEAEAAASNDALPASLRTLPIVLQAGESGRLGTVYLGEQKVEGLDALRKELKSILTDPNLRIDQTVIKSDPTLRYSELMHVIDAVSGQGVTKISFAELNPGESA
jgi:biopolymer transport protein ExbD